MGRGYEYSAELKEIFFRVISFIESETNGTQIPVYNTTQRSQAILGISKRSIFNLKSEMKRLKEQAENQQKKKDEEKQKENQENQKKQTEEKEQLLNMVHLRSQSVDATTISDVLPHQIKHGHVESQNENGKHLYPGRNHCSNEVIQADQLLFLVIKPRILSSTLSMPCLQKRSI